ncbi:alpha/beta hydrolase [Bacillus spongiae]|uniref:Alpha/beta hydrolase n=1 Tax=Bacillus spongiae TaxID=2683610 RepID=A0ABU8HHA0_9BACI
MKHLFEKGKDPSKPTLLLLHGTGGNEEQLLPIAKMIDDEASILSVRGNVLENGMPRYFRRIAEGVFDEEDLIFRTKELNHFLDESAETYEFDRDQVVAIGYSNGANIAGSLLFQEQNALKGAILHHPMVPRRGIELPDLSETSVFIGAGSNDPLCSPAESTELHSLLVRAKANVELHWEDKGHQLTMEEVEAAAIWYRKQYSNNK